MTFSRLKSPQLRFALKVLASLSLLGFVLYNTDVTSAITAIGSVVWWYWPTAIGLSFLAQIISAKRWHVLSDHVSFTVLLRQTFISNVYAFVIPSALAADAAKVISVPKSTDGWIGATARVVVDKIVGIVVIAALTMPALYMSTNIDLGPLRSTLAYVSISFIGLFGLSLIPLFRREMFRILHSARLQVRVLRRVSDWLDRVSSNVKMVNFSVAALSTNFALALAFQGLILLQLNLAAVNVGISISIWNLVLLSSLIQLSFFIPLGVAGVGVKDVAQVSFLVMLGASKQQAVEMVMLGYPLVLTLVVIGYLSLNTTKHQV